MFSDYYNEERKRKELEEAGLGTSAFPQVYLQRGKVKKEKSEADPETSSIEEERDMVDCFLAFQDARFSPRKMQNLVMDLLESGQEARSTSEKAFG